MFFFNFFYFRKQAILTGLFRRVSYVCVVCIFFIYRVELLDAWRSHTLTLDPTCDNHTSSLTILIYFFPSLLLDKQTCVNTQIYTE